ncbi:MAG: hypothetical protein QXG44_09050 [Candidatus Jordarchaeaceae archaeon]
MFYEKWKLKPKSEKQWGALAVLTLILISSITIISLYTPSYNNPYFEPIFFSSGQNVSSYPKDAIYLYPNRNDTNVDGAAGRGSHSYFPNLAIAGEYDTINESNTVSPNVQILVPNGPGNNAELYAYNLTGNLESNWECANSSDGDNSYVYYNNTDWKRDLYNIAGPDPTGSGAINWVRVGISVKTFRSSPSQKGDAEILVLIGSTLFEYPYYNIPTSYTNYSVLFEKSPDTGEPWAWNELENLQVGVRLKLRNTPQIGEMVRCTFIWVEVNYTIPNYELDLELQWTSIPPTTSNSELCIKTGSFSGNENLSVECWNGSNWIEVIHNLGENQWNNVSLYIDGSVFTIRFKGSNETQDVIQDYWEIDLSLISINYKPQTVYLEQLFLLLFGSFLLGGGSRPSLPSIAFIVGSAALVSISVLVIRYSYFPGEAASFRKKRIKQLQEARERVRRALEDGGGGAS